MLSKKNFIFWSILSLFITTGYCQFKFTEDPYAYELIKKSEYEDYHDLKNSLRSFKNDFKIYYRVLDSINLKKLREVKREFNQLKKETVSLRFEIFNFIELHEKNNSEENINTIRRYFENLDSLKSKKIKNNRDLKLKLQRDSISLRNMIKTVIENEDEKSELGEKFLRVVKKIDRLYSQDLQKNYSLIQKLEDKLDLRTLLLGDILERKEKFWTTIMFDLENKIRSTEKKKNQIAIIKKEKVLRGLTLREDEIRALNKELTIFDKKIDSLKEQLKLEKAKLDITMFKKKRHKFLLRNIEAVEVFRLAYDEEESFQILNNSGLNIGGGASSVYSEIITDRVGPVRIGFGAMVTKSQNDSINAEANKSEALQKVLTYGGNTVLTLDYPIFWSSSKTNNARSVGFLSLKAAADLPDLGTETENFAGNLSIGFNIYGELSTDRKLFKLFADISSKCFFGTKSFRENLDISEKNFTLTTIRVGLLIDNSISISIQPITYSSAKNFERNSAILSVNIN